MKKERSKLIRKAILVSQEAYRKKQIGKTITVLWEKCEPVEKGPYKLSGFSDNYLPVSAFSFENLYNEISTVEIMALSDEKVVGRIKEIN